MKKSFEMNKEEFDNILRKNLTAQTGQNSFGYKVSWKKDAYINYYKKNEFEKFLLEMQSPKYQSIFERYKNGEGSELKEYKRGGREYPPKMASVASSSRFCYLALRDGAEGLGGSGSVDFEHGCPIKGIAGTAPQLDAYIPNENIYVEAKCHEIFDQHKITMKKAYWNLIYGPGNEFGFPAREKTNEETFEIPLSSFGFEAEKQSSMFDIKQFICHLLGIAAQEKGDVPASLVYLFFKPKVQQSDEVAEIDKIFCALQKEIEIVFGSKQVRHFIEKNNIRLGAIAEYAEVMEVLTAENRMELAGDLLYYR